MKALFSLGMLVVTFAAGISTAAATEPPADTPRSVAAAYFKAMDAADLDAAEKLFAAQSEVFETGGQEGSWKHYREHHLGPEIEGVASFVTTLGQSVARSSQDESMAYVAWPIEYKIVLKDERVIESKGTVTFIMVREEGSYRITHLHWSSRRK